MAYRHFRPLKAAYGPATLANVATLRPPNPPTVARLATVADRHAANRACVDLEDWQAYFDERAAIREYDGGFPRPEAERLALKDTVAALGPRPTGSRGLP